MTILILALFFLLIFSQKLVSISQAKKHDSIKVLIMMFFIIQIFSLPFLILGTNKNAFYYILLVICIIFFVLYFWNFLTTNLPKINLKDFKEAAYSLLVPTIFFIGYIIYTVVITSFYDDVYIFRGANKIINDSKTTIGRLVDSLTKKSQLKFQKILLPCLNLMLLIFLLNDILDTKLTNYILVKKVVFLGIGFGLFVLISKSRMNASMYIGAISLLLVIYYLKQNKPILIMVSVVGMNIFSMYGNYFNIAIFMFVLPFLCIYFSKKNVFFLMSLGALSLFRPLTIIFSPTKALLPIYFALLVLNLFAFLIYIYLEKNKYVNNILSFDFMFIKNKKNKILILSVNIVFSLIAILLFTFFENKFPKIPHWKSFGMIVIFTLSNILLYWDLFAKNKTNPLVIGLTLISLGVAFSLFVMPLIYNKFMFINIYKMSWLEVAHSTPAIIYVLMISIFYRKYKIKNILNFKKLCRFRNIVSK